MPQRRIRLSNQCQGLELDPSAIRGAIRSLDDSGHFSVPPGELSVVFVDNEKIAAIHRDFLNDPKPTDVITFPGSPEMNFAGEICVSAEMAAEYAQRHNLCFSDELSLYLIHGYLHLAHYDDLDPAAKRRMRQAEKKAMNFLTESGKMPHFALAQE